MSAKFDFRAKKQLIAMFPKQYRGIRLAMKFCVGGCLQSSNWVSGCRETLLGHIIWIWEAFNYSLGPECFQYKLERHNRQTVSEAINLQSYYNAHCTSLFALQLQ